MGLNWLRFVCRRPAPFAKRLSANLTRVMSIASSAWSMLDSTGGRSGVGQDPTCTNATEKVDRNERGSSFRREQGGSCERGTSWNRFQQANRGQGLSTAQMAKLYKQQTAGAPIDANKAAGIANMANCPIFEMGTPPGQTDHPYSKLPTRTPNTGQRSASCGPAGPETPEGKLQRIREALVDETPIAKTMDDVLPSETPAAKTTDELLPKQDHAPSRSDRYLLSEGRKVYYGEECLKLVCRGISRAVKRILVMVFCLSHMAVVEALTQACQMGVRVYVLLDVRQSTIPSARAAIAKLRECGAHLRMTSGKAWKRFYHEYPDQVDGPFRQEPELDVGDFHYKSMILDRAALILGSMNFTYRSVNKSKNSMAVNFDSSDVEHAVEVFKQEWSEAGETDSGLGDTISVSMLSTGSSARVRELENRIRELEQEKVAGVGLPSGGPPSDPPDDDGDDKKDKAAAPRAPRTPAAKGPKRVRKGMDPDPDDDPDWDMDDNNSDDSDDDSDVHAEAREAVVGALRGVDVKALPVMPDLPNMQQPKRLEAGQAWVVQVFLILSQICPKNRISEIFFRLVRKLAGLEVQDYLNLDEERRGFHRVRRKVPEKWMQIENRLGQLLNEAIIQGYPFRYRKSYGNYLTSSLSESVFNCVELLYFVLRSMWGNEDQSRLRMMSVVFSPDLPRSLREFDGKVSRWCANLLLCSQLGIPLPDPARMRQLTKKLFVLVDHVHEIMIDRCEQCRVMSFAT